jgi:hypothetical protein
MLMRIDDLCWFAGIMDGEGHVKLLRSSTNVVRLGMMVTNTEMLLLDEVKRLAGVGNIYSAGPAIAGSKPGFRWEIGSRAEVKRLLTMLLPYMRIKCRQAKLLLEWIEIAPYHKKNSITPTRCYEIEAEMRVLNKRGVDLVDAA